MAFRIAFDLDGVLADMDAALVHEARTLFGEAVARRLQQDSAPPADPESSSAAAADGTAAPAPDGPEGTPRESEGPLPPTRLRLTARQERRLWRHVAAIENFWETLTEIEPDCVRRLAAVADARRWEVIFITRRPETAGATAQVQTQRWLAAHGFALPSVFVVRRSRGRVAAALGLDFLVDDTPQNCLDVVVESSARAVLVWRDQARQVPPAAARLGIGVVRSVDECLNILADVDASSRERPGVIARVLQLLGLKEAAAARVTAPAPQTNSASRSTPPVSKS